MNNWTPHPNSKGEARHLSEKSLFCHLCQRSHSFFHYSKLVTKNWSKPVNWQFHFCTPLGAAFASLRPHPSINLPFPSLVSPFLTKNHGFRLRRGNSHPDRFTLLWTAGARAWGHRLMKPTEPHHLWKDDMRFWGHQGGSLVLRNSSPCPQSTCRLIEQTSDEHSNNLERIKSRCSVQAALFLLNLGISQGDWAVWFPLVVSLYISEV